MSAGEIFFELLPKNGIRVREVTNQSTGYCPSVHSWPHVEKALSQLGIEYPDSFDPFFDFSYCRECKSLKVIKEDFLFCHRCGNALPDGEEFQRLRNVLLNIDKLY
ncbi:MAG: hypothetical protein K9J31_16120 [Saprospiraceae bacterium]|nr:hypothetical protein [Saprospiraceae bacterium]